MRDSTRLTIISEWFYKDKQMSEDMVVVDVPPDNERQCPNLCRVTFSPLLSQVSSLLQPAPVVSAVLKLEQYNSGLGSNMSH